jgi:hypothetical protein
VLHSYLRSSLDPVTELVPVMRHNVTLNLSCMIRSQNIAVSMHIKVVEGFDVFATSESAVAKDESSTVHTTTAACRYGVPYRPSH